MTSLRKLACAICLLPLAGVAAAQTGEAVDLEALSPIDRMGITVSTHVAENLQGFGDLFTPQIMFQLGAVAQQKVIALKCDGYDLDPVRYGAVMDSILTPLIEMSKTTESDTASINLPFLIAMNQFSILVGGNLAAAGYDLDAFCALGKGAREAMAEEGGEALLIWADAK